MATLRKGNQGTKFPTSLSSFILLACLGLAIVQTKSAVREQDSPLIKSIKVSFLGHRVWGKSMKSDSRGKNNGNIFSTIPLISSVEINDSPT